MRRQVKQTELGTEIQCSKCKEFYPADNEFFPSQPADKKYGCHSWCHACMGETKRKQYHKDKEAACN